MAYLSVDSYAKNAASMKSFLGSHIRRVESMPPGVCPVAEMMALIHACAAQTCGKCTPCREGLPKILADLERVASFQASHATLDDIKTRAKLLCDRAACAIGYHAGELALQGLSSFESEFLSHVEKQSCGKDAKQVVPCVTLCPAHVNVPAYISLVQEENISGAIKMIRKDNPFTTACALVCEHPCESRCRRTLIDAPVNIRGIKKFAVDSIPADKVETPVRAGSTGKRVAVIGGGPSGMTCAYFASLMGHDVTVFEAHNKLGGMMRYGIPAYRFPRERLDEDLRAILGVGGINVELNHKIDAAEMAQIAAEFDAVYVAIGAQGGKTLAIEGADATGVMSAVNLLGQIGDDKYPDFSGKRVVVIGGGNVAMDCARSAVRANAKDVSVVYRRRLEDMTALSAEIESAMQEGVEMMCLQAPVRIEKNTKGNVAALICQPQYIGAVKHGRPAPVNANKPEIRVDADVVLIAVGQGIESATFEEFGMKADRTYFVADEHLRSREFENVFVGGDCQLGPKTVIMAIAAGKIAARNIDEMLGFNHVIDCGVKVPPARQNDRTSYGRVQIAKRPARERKRDFSYVELPMSKEEAAQECDRCLRCDVFGIGALNGRKLEQW